MKGTGRTLVIGDIHGRIEALKEVLAKAHFDYENDLLISLGDIVDGGYNTYEVVEELLKIKHLIVVVGNHDIFFMNHLSSGWVEEIWTSQGGANTLKSYGAKGPSFELDLRGVNVPVTHQDFFNRMLPYYIDEDRLFVHGGFDARHGKTVQDTDIEMLTWDRDLIEFAREGNKIPGYKEIYVGHTTTQTYGFMEIEPLRFGQLFMLDTGAGFNGVLTIMDIDTKEYWQSKLQRPG